MRNYSINFGITKLARKGETAKVKNQEMTEAEFFEYIQDSAEISSVSISGDEDKEQYNRKKKRADGIVAPTISGTRRKADTADRSILFYDLDKTDSRTLRKVRRAFKESGVSHVFHTTTGDRHELKGGTRSARFLVLTNKPVPVADLGRAQLAFLHSVGLEDVAFDDCTKDVNRLMYLPHSQATIDCVSGKPARLRKLLALADDLGLDAEEESELIEDTHGNNSAISDWCFDQGFEPLASGRGYEVPCPNEHLHSGEGSTSIMLDGKEVRFVCLHTNNGCCSELNRHQHLALRLLGVPDSVNVEPHQLSRKQIADMLPSMDDEEVINLYEHITDAVGEGAEYGECSDFDLENEPTSLFTKHDPIIEGMVNFKSTWYMAGESNIGKSFLVLGQMGAVSAGIPFGGARVVQSHCYYFDAEGGESSEQRKQALREKYNDNLDRLHIIDLQQRGWDITSKQGLREVIKHIMQTSNGEPVGLIAFDSLNQTVALRSADAKPFDENNASDMGEVVKALKAIAENTGGSAGVIHHPAKSSNGNRSPRGSGALHGAVDSAFFLEQPDESRPGEVNLYHEKARNGVKQGPRGFLLLTCKVAVDDRKTEDFEAHLSTNTGPDWSDVTAAHDIKPLTIAPRGETLYLVPVALAPFGLKPAAVDKPKEENKAGPKGEKEKLMYASLEQLMADHPDSNGFSARQIMLNAGVKPGGSTSKPVYDLLERGIFAFYKDPDTGAIYGKQNIVIPSGIRHELVANDGDLDD